MNHLPSWRTSVAVYRFGPGGPALDLLVLRQVNALVAHVPLIGAQTVLFNGEIPELAIAAALVLIVSADPRWFVVIMAAVIIGREIAVSALRAQQARMRVIAENLANADSTATTKGGNPYRRQVAVFQPTKVDGATGVAMARVAPDQSSFKMSYQPGNPAADAQGYVKQPNVDPLVEALDMREAQRAYEANLSVIEGARSMDASTLDLLKK